MSPSWNSSRMIWMALVIMTCLAWARVVPAAEKPEASLKKATVIVVVGAGGEKEFGDFFATAAQDWKKAITTAEARGHHIGPSPQGPSDEATPESPTDLDKLKARLEEEPKESAEDLWVILIGHGTYDGKEARFNLRGPDFTPGQLAAWLVPFKRPVIVVNAFSSSGPFLKPLARPGRTVITATRSGSEQNFSRFSGHFAKAIGNLEADLDKDGQTSLLEAYLMAARKVSDFYKTEGRLATEHALLDDNGDGLGTPPDWFRGIRAVKKSKKSQALDGLRAHQVHLIRSELEKTMPSDLRRKRDDLELSIAKLRETKKDLGEEEYYRKLQALLLDVAEIYETLEPKTPSDPAP